jgi:putative chitinase
MSNPILTPIALQRIFRELRNASTVCDALKPAFDKYEINSPARVAAFIAQTGHESAGFTAKRENLNYSAKGLLATWPRRFNPTKAQAFHRQPEKIANEVYGKRLGNDKPGDGWRYRGGGFIQLTGRENYRRVGHAIGVPLEDKPELIERLDVSALAAGYFWASNGLNALADDLLDDDDDADFVLITRKINGGTTGLAERRALWKLAKQVLGA